MPWPSERNRSSAVGVRGRSWERCWHTCKFNFVCAWQKSGPSSRLILPTPQLLNSSVLKSLIPTQIENRCLKDNCQFIHTLKLYVAFTVPFFTKCSKFVWTSPYWIYQSWTSNVENMAHILFIPTNKVMPFTVLIFMKVMPAVQLFTKNFMKIQHTF
jgi:hypothetical protein